MKYRTEIKKGVLEANVNFPNLKLKMQSQDPVSSLKQLNKIVHTLKAIEFNRDFLECEDDPIQFRLGYLSEELRSNEKVMNFIKSALQAEDNFKYKKASIENTQVIDVASKNYTTSINLNKIKKKINELCTGMEQSNHLLIHIMGSTNSEEKQSIVDVIKNKMNNTEIRSVLTHKEILGKTVIEILFFGAFEEEY